MTGFGLGESKSYWITYLWDFFTDRTLRNLQERINQSITTNLESRPEDLPSDYQETFTDDLLGWHNLFKWRHNKLFQFLQESNILESIQNAIDYYKESEQGSPLSLHTFNLSTETHSIASAIRLTYDITYCIIELCDNTSPDWASIAFALEEIRFTFGEFCPANTCILRAVFRIDTNNRIFDSQSYSDYLSQGT